MRDFRETAWLPDNSLFRNVVTPALNSYRNQVKRFPNLEN